MKRVYLMVIVVSVLTVLLVVDTVIITVARAESSYQTPAGSTGSYVPQPDLLKATIMSNGSIVPDTVNITRVGNTYTLSSDLEGYIVIEQSNCIFDGNGHTVMGVYGPIPTQGNSQIDGLTGTTIVNTVVKQGGIIFYGYLKSNNLMIANNTVNSGTGIDCSGNGNVVANNSINKGRGISCAGSNNISSGNNLQGCDQWNSPIPYGISISGSNNKIFANTLAGTKGYAVDIARGSSRNIIAGNQITNNQVGVHTSYAISQGGAEGNLIYKNNFIGNGQNVYNEAIVSTTISVNFWDDGKEGNYWSNHNGQGAYIIDQSNIDNHPLPSPVDISKLTLGSLSSVPSYTPIPTPIPTPSPISSLSPSSTPTLQASPSSTILSTPTPKPSITITPTPTPSQTFTLAPTSSQTIQPTTQPTQTASPTLIAIDIQTQDNTLTATVLSIVTVAIIAGILVYIKRRK